VALASLVLAALTTARAEAQFGVPGGGFGPGVIGGGIGRPALVTGGFIPQNPNIGLNPYVNPGIDPFSPISPLINPLAAYGFGLGLNPTAGYLMGVADVTNANAQYQVTIQRARMLNEEALRSQLATRRAAIEEARWERATTPGAEDIRLREMAMSLARSRRNPPVGEIWSGKALNDILAYLIDQQGKGAKGPDVSLTEDMLAKINVTDGTGGNVGLLKDGGKVLWPAVLQGPDFTPMREMLDKKLPDAVETLRFNRPVEKGTLDAIKSALKSAQQKLDDSVGKLTPTESLQGNRFLGQLDDAFKVLQSPMATNYFTGKWAAKAGNVRELVDQMTKTGLRFAAATPGDEAAYRALYNAVASYDAGIQSLTTQPVNTQPPMPPR